MSEVVVNIDSPFLSAIISELNATAQQLETPGFGKQLQVCQLIINDSGRSGGIQYQVLRGNFSSETAAEVIQTTTRMMSTFRDEYKGLGSNIFSITEFSNLTIEGQPPGLTTILTNGLVRSALVDSFSTLSTGLPPHNLFITTRDGSMIPAKDGKSQIYREGPKELMFNMLVGGMRRLPLFPSTKTAPTIHDQEELLEVIKLKLA